MTSAWKLDACYFIVATCLFSFSSKIGCLQNEVGAGVRQKPLRQLSPKGRVSTTTPESGLGNRRNADFLPRQL